MVNFAGVEIHNFGKPFLCELTLKESWNCFRLKWAQSKILYLFVNDVVLPLSKNPRFDGLGALNALWKVRNVFFTTILQLLFLCIVNFI